MKTFVQGVVLATGSAQVNATISAPKWATRIVGVYIDNSGDALDLDVNEVPVLAAATIPTVPLMIPFPAVSGGAKVRIVVKGARAQARNLNFIFSGEDT